MKKAEEISAKEIIALKSHAVGIWVLHQFLMVWPDGLDLPPQINEYMDALQPAAQFAIEHGTEIDAELKILERSAKRKRLKK